MSIRNFIINYNKTYIKKIFSYDNSVTKTIRIQPPDDNYPNISFLQKILTNIKLYKKY